MRYTIKSVKNIFEKEGYILLSTEYINNKQKLEVLCPEGHLWKIGLKGFHICGYRCSKCKRKRKYTLEEAQQIFKNRGYTLVSKEYVGVGEKLTTICPNEHIYVATLGAFLNKGNGCKICNGTQPWKRKDAEEFLREWGYELVSDVWKTTKSWIELRCPLGHLYKTKLTLFKNQGLRCKICNINVQEENIRSIFEEITGKKFNKIKPLWLKNPKTGKNLELDGFCEELMIAFEYDGVLHYKPIHGKKVLKAQKNRDKIKDRLCNKYSVKLIRIPYFIEDKREYIEKELQNAKRR